MENKMPFEACFSKEAIDFLIQVLADEVEVRKTLSVALHQAGDIQKLQMASGLKAGLESIRRQAKTTPSNS